MNSKRLLKNVLVVFLALICFSSCEHRLKSNPAIKNGTLENGMTYYVLRNAEPENRIMLRLVVRAGSNMEEEDQRGVAHLVEHMAFNGSEHFEENALVSYFESIGMNFGPEVNAYTSFDETVYMLEVPADDPEMLKTGMLVLRDWACAISFDQVQLDKERGVVTEEWRLGRGLNGRITDTMVPLLLKDSRYAERLPIGSMDVVQNVSRERVVDFYKTWYRPELMSVVLVGDADEKVLEKAIKDAMSDIPASEKRIERPEYSIPSHSQKSIEILRDKEQPYPLVEILEPLVLDKCLTESDFRYQMIIDFSQDILNQRLSDITATASSPWLDAACFTDSFAQNVSFKALAFVPKQDMFDASLKLLLDEYDRLCVHGITSEELELEKQTVLSSIKQTYENRFHVSSASHASQIVDQILTGEPDLSYEDFYRLTTKSAKSIRLEEVNNAVKELLSDRGTLLLALAPEDSTDVPSKEVLYETWRNYQSPVALEAKEESKLDGQIYERPKTKTSVKTKTRLSDLGATEYVLENNVRIIFKKTKFVDNSFVFYAGSQGGLSLVDDADIPSAKVASEYVSSSGANGISSTDFGKILSGYNVSLSFDIDDYDEYFYGWAASSDAEKLLQSLSAYFVKPDFTDDGWERVYSAYKTSADTRGADPSDAFADELISLVYGDSVRHLPVNASFLAQMNRSRAEELYRQRFNNAADFTYIFVGDFNENKLLSLCRYYLGNLPTSEQKEEPVWKEVPFPKGIKSSVVNRGIEPQSTVYIAFGTDLAATGAKEAWLDSELIDALASLLEIKLRESLREDKGGTYGVGVDTWISSMQTLTSPRQACVHISFGCEPGREQELIDGALSVIEQLQIQGVDEETLVKLRENYRRNKEVSLKDNYWWLGQIASAGISNQRDVAFITDCDTVPETISSECMRSLVMKYCPLNNYITATLEPEN